MHHEVGDELIGCSESIDEWVPTSYWLNDWLWFSFEVPFAPEWSIGLLHYDLGLKTDAATYVYKTTGRGILGDFLVGHRTRVHGTTVDSVDSRPIWRGFGNAQKVGTEHRVGIRVGVDGVQMSLNGRDVLTVPASELRPTSSKVRICAGLVPGEPEDYSIDYFGSFYR